MEIISRHSHNPIKQENYNLLCHSHCVRIIVTSKTAVVRKWVQSVRYRHRFQLRCGRLVVGLGVQWTPGRKTASTFQLCVGHNCLIFQLVHAAQSPAVLRRFISNPDVIFVGVWNYRDAAMLSDSIHRLRVRTLVDLRHPASDYMGCSKSASMETLALEILGLGGMVKEEEVGFSGWDAVWLTKEQVKYASRDAFLSFLIAKKLRIWKMMDDSFINHAEI